MADSVNGGLTGHMPAGDVPFRSHENPAAVVAGGIAHDLGNIITVIAGTAQLIQSRRGSGDPEERSIRNIIEASERALALIKELLSSGRSRALKPCLTDLNTIIENTGTFLVHLLDKRVSLDMALTGQALPVYADTHHIEQVLMNLVVNAYDAMPCGGRITVATHFAEEGIAPAFEPRRYAAVTVTDNGTGMDAETQTRMFEPYFTTKKDGSGTGLGLALVRSIVEQHRGTITVSSELGRGTTVILRLPLHQAQELQQR